MTKSSGGGEWNYYWRRHKLGEEWRIKGKRHSMKKELIEY